MEIGGLLYSSQASTSSDITKPADNIKLITTRHMFMPMIVVHNAVDLQTKSFVTDDNQAFASHHNLNDQSRSGMHFNAAMRQPNVIQE